MAVAACALMATSCFSKKTAAVVEPAAPATTGAVVPLSTQAGKVLNGVWAVADVAGSPVDMAEFETESPTLTFDIDGQGIGSVIAYCGCNYMNGDVAIGIGGKVSRTGSFLSTMMACDDKVMATESAIGAALNEMTTYAVDHVDGSYFLYLKNEAGDTILTARRWDMNFINGAWAVTQIGNRGISVEDEVQLVLDIPQAHVHGNTGCNILNGAINITTQRVLGLEFTNLATTRMACPGEHGNVERDLLTALEEVASCKADGNGRALLLNGDGSVLVRLRRIDLKN